MDPSSPHIPPPPAGYRTPRGRAGRRGGRRRAQARSRRRPPRRVRRHRGAGPRGVGASRALAPGRRLAGRGRGGALVGYGLCWMEAPPGEPDRRAARGPRARGRGLNELLLGLCEARAADLLRAASPRAAAARSACGRTRATRAGCACSSGAATAASVRSCGSTRDLDDTLAAPAWPAGISVAAFRPGVDDAAVHAAHEEAFADHYGPAEMDLEEWHQSRFAHEGPDLGLWLVAWDGTRWWAASRPWRRRRALHGRALRAPSVARTRHRQGPDARGVRGAAPARHAKRVLRRRRRQHDGRAAPARVAGFPLAARADAAVTRRASAAADAGGTGASQRHGTRRRTAGDTIGSVGASTRTT